MKKLRIKIGASPLEDMKGLFKDMERSEPGTHTIYIKSPEDLYEMLSPKRMELLRHIIANQKEPVKNVSKELRRKQEAISRDASILERHGILKKICAGRETLLKSEFSKIEISLAD